MAGGGGAVIIAVAVRKERDLVNHFRRARALSPDTSTTSASMGVEERHAWHRLARRGVIRQAPNSGWYLDESALAAWDKARRKRAMVLIAVVIAVFAATLVRSWLQ